DITDRKRAERALREGEQHFRTLADAAPVLIWMSDVSRQCTYFNKRWLEFTGRDQAEVVGYGWATGVPPDDVVRSVAFYAGSFERHEPFVMEYRLRRADGAYRWILDEGVPRYDTSSVFAGYIGSCIDITERKRVEEAIRESEARLKLMAQVVPEIIWTALPDG